MQDLLSFLGYAANVYSLHIFDNEPYAQLSSQGANSYGQLGLGNAEDKLLPCKVLLEDSQVKLVKQISGGGGHTVLLKGMLCAIERWHYYTGHSRTT